VADAQLCLKSALKCFYTWCLHLSIRRQPVSSAI